MNKSTHIKDMRFLPPLYLQPCYCWNRFYSSTSQLGNGGCSPRWDIWQHLYQQRRLIQQQGGTVCSLRWAHGASLKAPARGQLVLRGRTSVLVSAAERDIRKRRVKNLADSRRKTVQQGRAWRFMVIYPSSVIFRKPRFSSLNPPSALTRTHTRAR